MELGKYNKFIVALAGAAVIFLVSFFGKDSTLTNTVVTILTALGVYQLPNSK